MAHDSDESTRTCDYGRPTRTPSPPRLTRADEVIGKGGVAPGRRHPGSGVDKAAEGAGAGRTGRGLPKQTAPGPARTSSCRLLWRNQDVRRRGLGLPAGNPAGTSRRSRSRARLPPTQTRRWPPRPAGRLQVAGIDPAPEQNSSPGADFHTSRPTPRGPCARRQRAHHPRGPDPAGAGRTGTTGDQASSTSQLPSTRLRTDCGST